VSKLIKKILLAEKILKKAYNDSNGKLFISFSGGKDSTVLRHITLRLYPNLKCVFSNTTNEIKEVVDYVKTFPNIITVKPKLSFSQVVKKTYKWKTNKNYKIFRKSYNRKWKIIY